MAAIPEPRRPVCRKHHVWHVDCAECTAQRQAERDAAKQRLAAT